MLLGLFLVTKIWPPGNDEKKKKTKKVEKTGRTGPRDTKKNKNKVDHCKQQNSHCKG